MSAVPYAISDNPEDSRLGWPVWYAASMRQHVVERRGKLEELDRSFDQEFWQSQTPKARFDATWDLIVHYARVKGIDVRQLRLQRSVESFQRQAR